jgi:glycosyltransferase involved in cell wall biosynthesis
VRWDMPLLEGYAHEFVPNVSAQPGTNRFGGLRNPELNSRVRAFDPDAVLLVGYNYQSLIRFILTWRAVRAPLILRGDSHRLMPDLSWRGRLKRALLSVLFRRFAAFLYVGAANRRYFEQHGVPARALFWAPHAVDNARFTATGAATLAAARAWRRELGIADDRMVVLFAGKFEAKKRPLDLLRAFRALAPADAALLLVGSGELERQLREEAQGCADIHFAPFQNQSQMPRTYAACDVLVLPSYGRFETWGLAVNEAMCLGKAAIVSDHVGCAEDLVLNGKTGLVFAAGDLQALTGALAQALRDRQRLQAWGAAARQRVQGFNYAQATRGLMDALAFVSRRRSASRPS